MIVDTSENGIFHANSEEEKLVVTLPIAIVLTIE